MGPSTRADVRIAVPDGAFTGDKPLVAVERGGYISALHRGTIAVADASGRLVLGVGTVEQPAFLRSAAKPFQAMPAVLSGAVDRYGVTERELAVLCASHSGEPQHMEAVLGVLEKAGLDEAALHCGIHAPLHEETARRRWRVGLDPSPVCNNCSGAHTGMLLACRAMGWPIERYEEPDHPLQQWIQTILAAFAGTEGSVQYGIDNCAVPTFLLPLQHAARAFSRLVSGEGPEERLGEAARRIAGAMVRYPEMVGGEHRFDTALMRVAGGSILAKGGAEGFQSVGFGGLGMAIKISDGNAPPLPPVALAVLEHLGALDEEQLNALGAYREPQIYNHQGKLVGRLVPVFSFGGGM